MNQNDQFVSTSSQIDNTLQESQRRRRRTDRNHITEGTQCQQEKQIQEFIEQTVAPQVTVEETRKSQYRQVQQNPTIHMPEQQWIGQKRSYDPYRTNQVPVSQNLSYSVETTQPEIYDISREHTQRMQDLVEREKPKKKWHWIGYILGLLVIVLILQDIILDMRATKRTNEHLAQVAEQVGYNYDLSTAANIQTIEATSEAPDTVRVTTEPEISNTTSLQNDLGYSQPSTTVTNAYQSDDCIKSILYTKPYNAGSILINLPEVPLTLSSSGQSLTITDWKLESENDYSQMLLFSGEANRNQFSTSSTTIDMTTEIMIDWRIRDQYGYIVSDGIMMTPPLATGEKFKDYFGILFFNQEFDKLDSGEYILQLQLDSLDFSNNSSSEEKSSLSEFNQEESSETQIITAVTDAEINRTKITEQVLNRKIFAFMNDLPDMYAAGIKDIDQSVAYTEDWHWGRILNEETFDTINWEISEADNETIILEFQGTIRINERSDKVKIQFLLLQDATIPIISSMEIQTEEESSKVSIQDYLDQNLDIVVASLITDATAAQLLTVLYLSSDTYIEQEEFVKNYTNKALVTKPSYAKGDTVHLRQKPNGKIILDIPFGTEVDILDEQDEWSQIIWDNQSGWMKSEFLSICESTVGFLSYDITGEWYEWFVVQDLLTAYSREESPDSLFGIDRFFTEDLLVPSDGKQRSIHLNSNNEYVFDNWDDCKITICGNNQLCILDGYEEDSVQIATLSFVDEKTMWYFGNNEYVAVYQRTKPEIITADTIDTPTCQYSDIINRYSLALHDKELWDHYSETDLNLFAIEDLLSYGGTLQYAEYDINQDGYDELLIASNSDGYFSIVDIYTTDGENLIRLFGDRSFGYRDNLSILTNGWLYTHGSSGADNVCFEVYTFTNRGFLEKIQAIDYSGDNMGAVEELEHSYKEMILDADSEYSWAAIQ